MKKKGFTLIELIIVIAIIGILSGVLIPSWGYYIQRSRTRAQNLKAKTIFNAVQTLATDMKFEERRYVNILKDDSATEAEKAKAKTNIYGVWNNLTKTTSWCLYFNDTTAGFWDIKNFDVAYGNGDALIDENLQKDRSNYRAKKSMEIHKSVSNIVNDKDTVYKVYVVDYKVVSVASARSANDRYIGTYPKTLDQLEYEGVNVDEIRENKILNLNMKDIAL